MKDKIIFNSLILTTGLEVWSYKTLNFGWINIWKHKHLKAH